LAAARIQGEPAGLSAEEASGCANLVTSQSCSVSRWSCWSDVEIYLLALEPANQPRRRRDH